MESNNEDIDHMMRAKSNLESLPNELKNEEYKMILNLIKQYIENNCKHHIICDSIDLNYDESRTIYYCLDCMKTFDNI
jgi:RNA binding exosome subunit